MKYPLYFLLLFFLPLTVLAQTEVESRIGACAELGSYYYDGYVSAELEECLYALLSDYPDDPAAVVYVVSELEGDTVIHICNEILIAHVEDRLDWPDADLSYIYQYQSYQYLLIEDLPASLDASKQAEILNEEIDLSHWMAHCYYYLGNDLSAEEQIRRNLATENPPYYFLDKARIAQLIGKSGLALELFERARAIEFADSTMVPAVFDSLLLADIYLDNKRFAEARSCLTPYYKKDFDRGIGLQQLTKFDLKYSPADSALRSYRALVSESFFYDAFGKYRLKLLLKAPRSSWSGEDFFRLVMLLTVFLVIVLIPYLLTRPIKLFSQSARRELLPGTNWQVNDVWLFASSMLLIYFLGYFIFDYDFLNYTLFKVGLPEYYRRISQEVANSNLFHYCAVTILGVVIMWPYRKFLFSAKLERFLLLVFIGLPLAYLLSLTANAIEVSSLVPFGTEGQSVAGDAMISIIAYISPELAFLFIVICVPIAEEVLYRGLLLTALQKRFGFVAANTFQALLFSAVHFDLPNFLFYFIFGFLAGLTVYFTRSMIANTSMHMVNNLWAFYLTLAVM